MHPINHPPTHGKPFGPVTLATMTAGVCTKLRGKLLVSALLGAWLISGPWLVSGPWAVTLAIAQEASKTTKASPKKAAECKDAKQALKSTESTGSAGATEKPLIVKKGEEKKETPCEKAARLKKRKKALRFFRKGFALQKKFRTKEALVQYQKALEADPTHGKSHYEIGWSYWMLEDWKQVVAHWQAARKLKAGPRELEDYLLMARERESGKADPLVRATMGTQASAKRPDGSSLRLKLAARFQYYKKNDPQQRDFLDHRIFSPKSVHFLPDGSKAYVQSLEAGLTVVYNTTRKDKPHRQGVVRHRFKKAQQGLFDARETQAVKKAFAVAIKQSGAPRYLNRYQGKPVESAITHQGRYLWVSHYRRSYDRYGILPSSVAVIDTRTDTLMRVMPTGPIPKYLAVSPDGKLLAVIHWGDNTIGLVDISADNPARFSMAGQMVVGSQLKVQAGRKVNRDRYCGLCLRGAVFTPDSKYLLVARMSGGGIAVMDVEGKKHIGSVFGMRPTPRHLVLSPDGITLYVGSNSSGYVSEYRVETLIAAAKAPPKKGKRRILKPLREVRTGSGTRTIELSPDGRTLYAAVNQRSQLVAVDTTTFKVLLRIQADSYPVGLAVSPDGGQVWVTAQGRKLRGGNSVMVYQVLNTPPVAEAR